MPLLQDEGFEVQNLAKGDGPVSYHVAWPSNSKMKLEVVGGFPIRMESRSEIA